MCLIYENIPFFVKVHKYSWLAVQKKNGIVKPWRFLQGHIDNENQVTLLMGDYEKKTKEGI